MFYAVSTATQIDSHVYMHIALVYSVSSILFGKWKLE